MNGDCIIIKLGPKEEWKLAIGHTTSKSSILGVSSCYGFPELYMLKNGSTMAGKNRKYI